MTQITCKECHCVIVEDSSKIDTNQKYLQCPVCLQISKNPMYGVEKC